MGRSPGEWKSHLLQYSGLDNSIGYSPWNSPGQNTGVGGLSILQGIFPTQGSNPGLPHSRRILDQLSLLYVYRHMGFPGGSEVKVSACYAGDLGLIPGSGRSPGEGNGNPFQYSCLENPMDRGAWRATVHGVTESSTTK